MLGKIATGYGIACASAKKGIIFSAPLLFTIFTACGGGGDSPPVAPTTSPLAAGTDENKKHMEELIQQLLAGKNKSCESFGTKALAIIALTKGGGGGGGGAGGSNFTPNSGGTGNNTYNLGSLGGKDECADILNQILWNATRVKYQDGRPWINDVAAKMWLAKRLGSLLNRIGNNAAGPLGTTAASLLERYGGDIRGLVDKYIISRLGGGTSLRDELRRYGLGGGGNGFPQGGTFGYDEGPRIFRPRPSFAGGPELFNGRPFPPDILRSLPRLPP